MRSPRAPTPPRVVRDVGAPTTPAAPAGVHLDGRRARTEHVHRHRARPATPAHPDRAGGPTATTPLAHRLGGMTPAAPRAALPAPGARALGSRAPAPPPPMGATERALLACALPARPVPLHRGGSLATSFRHLLVAPGGVGPVATTSALAREPTSSLVAVLRPVPSESGRHAPPPLPRIGTVGLETATTDGRRTSLAVARVQSTPPPRRVPLLGAVPLDHLQGVLPRLLAVRRQPHDLLPRPPPRRITHHRPTADAEPAALTVDVEDGHIPTPARTEN